MRVLLLCCFLGAVLAAPQGYNYQVQIIGDNSGFTYDQLQLLQQQLQQQQHGDHQQLQQQLHAVEQQQESVNELATVRQTADQEGFQYGNQLQQSQQQQQQNIQLQNIALELQQPQLPKLNQVQLQSQQEQPELLADSQSESQLQQQLQAPVEAQADVPVEYQPPTPVRYNYAPQLPLPAPAPVPQRSSTQYNKEFYFLSAPQEDSELPQSVQQQLDQIKRNLRVVFIKTPEQNGIANAALQLAKQSAEGKTAIYVLSKQHDASELANKLKQIQSARRQPEVVFIKYKTPAEADHAQRTIQAQYEALDGPNNFNYDGVAPTHNFVGSLGVDSSLREVDKPSANYLPAGAKA